LHGPMAALAVFQSNPTPVAIGMAAWTRSRRNAEKEEAP
jgi:hypothetical protein